MLAGLLDRSVGVVMGGSWRRRVRLYRFLDSVPAGPYLLDLYRARFGSLRRVDLCARQEAIGETMRMLGRGQVSVEGRDVIEIGSGWHPILAVLLYGMGAKSIVMTDIARHVRGPFIEVVVDHCLQHARDLAVVTGCSETSLVARWEELRLHGRPWEDVFRARGITYRAPLDFGRTPLPAHSADIVVSHDTLGYATAEDVAAIMTATREILRPGGFAAHNISVYDDLTIHDPSIPPWNFLRYSHDTWERIGNARMHHQNRLRPASYARLASRAGLRILYEERTPFDEPVAQLNRAALDLEFRDLPNEEIVARHYLLVAQKPETLSGDQLARDNASAPT